MNEFWPVADNKTTKDLSSYIVEACANQSQEKFSDRSRTKSLKHLPTETVNPHCLSEAELVSLRLLPRTLVGKDIDCKRVPEH